MTLEGRDIAFASPAAANRRASSASSRIVAHPDLSVADNICIGDPPRRFGLIDRRRQRRLPRALARPGVDDIHPLAPVKDLPLSRRQMVEIAKALAGSRASSFSTRRLGADGGDVGRVFTC